MAISYTGAQGLDLLHALSIPGAVASPFCEPVYVSGRARGVCLGPVSHAVPGYFILMLRRPSRFRHDVCITDSQATIPRPYTKLMRYEFKALLVDAIRGMPCGSTCVVFGHPYMDLVFEPDAVTYATSGTLVSSLGLRFWYEERG